jgi:DNA-dependent RNA polymerase auxiliary subunit epsilon
MAYELGDDKHLITLNAIAQYAKPVEQKNLTNVTIEHATRTATLMLIILPQWAAEFPPFNLCRLSAVAKQAGYRSRVLDANIKGYRYYKEHIENKLDYKLWDPTTIWRWCGNNYIEIHQYLEPFLLTILDEIVSYNPTVAGFTVYQMNEEPTKWMIQKLKEKLPNIKIAVGGPNVQKGYFVKEEYYDYVVSGEGEEAILKILDEVDHNVTHPTQQYIMQPEDQRLNLNKFPMPDYANIDFNEYKISNGVTTELSRGCIAKCTFCEETHFWKYRQRMAVDALEEVEYLYHEKGTRVFWFIDSLVNGNLKELRAFAKGIISKELDIKWTGYARCDGRMDLEYMKDLADSGCIYLNYGCESGSQKVLNDMAKGVTISEMEQNFQHGKEVGISAATNWIVAFPTESYQNYADTMTFLYRNRDMNINNMSTGIGFGQGPETITGQNPDKFNLSYQKYLGHWITKDFKLGGTHTLMRVKCMSIFLDQIIEDRQIGYPIRPNLKKYHYSIEYLDSTVQNSVNYEQFDYNIIKTDINPYADGIVNEMWPLLRTLWRTRGGYTILVRFDPELDSTEFGNQYGTGKYSAEFNFSINHRGQWSGNFKWDFIQHWTHEPHKEEDRQGPFFAQDFSNMISNAAIRARRLAKPVWGAEGRTGSDYNNLFAEEKQLNETINWTFNHAWADRGDWSNNQMYDVSVPANEVKIKFFKKEEIQ